MLRMSSYAAAGYDLYNQPVTNRIIGNDYTWTYTDFPNYNSWENVAGYSVRVAQTDPYTITPLYSSWPSASSLAPGCSLGCGGCAITGGTIDLLHWPSSLDTATASTDSNGDIVVTAFNTTLTYPTVYVSFSNLYAADSCSRVGSRYPSTIIPITDVSGLSSIWVDGDGLGALTASFNLTDLNSPVPLSIYTRQPWCAAYTSQWTEPVDCVAGNATNPAECTATCPQTQPYEPIIVLPSGVLQSIDPAWASCSLDLRGNYDPPYLLTPYAAAAEPTVLSTSTPAPAMPASGPTNGAPTPTALPQTYSPEPVASPNPPAAQPTHGSGSQSSGGSGGELGSPPPYNVGGQSGGSNPNSGGSEDGSGSGRGSAGEGAAGGDVGASRGGNPNDGSGSGTGTGGLGPNGSPGSSPGNTGADAAGNVVGVLGDTGAGPGSNSGSGSPGAGPGGAGSGLAGAQGNGASGNDDSGNGGSGNSSPDIGSSGSGGANSGRPATGGSGNGNPSNPPNDPAPADPNSGGTQVGGQPAHADPNGSGVVIGGQTYQPGAVATIGGVPISVGSAGTVIAGGSTMALPTLAVGNPGSTADGFSGPASGGDDQSPAAIITIGGNPYIAYSGQPLVIAGTTIQPNGRGATIDGQKISIGAAGVVVGSQNVPFSDPNSDTVFTIGSQVYTAHSGTPLVIGSITLVPGGPAATISGKTISAATNGIIVDGSTIPDARATLGLTTAVAAPFTLAGVPYTAYALPSHPGTEVIVDPSGILTTLSIGGPAATISGQAISAVSNGVNVGRSFDPFRTITTTASLETAAIFTGKDGAVWTATEEPDPRGTGEIVLLENGSQTLTMEVGGKETVIDGETVSAGSSGLMVDGTTVAWDTMIGETNSDGTATSSLAVKTQTASPGTGGGNGGNGAAATGNATVAKASGRFGVNNGILVVFWWAVSLMLLV
ncbi:MAG: hypothetical protein Q9165_000350 [Trypethelium subeluteriae]